jgi:hypothetical protein
MSASDCEKWRSLVIKSLGGRIRELEVLPVPGAVVLRGRATSYHAKQLAQHVAMTVCGLRIQTNDIEVHRTAGPSPV